MAPVQNLYRLVWGGRLFTSEQWTCSLHLDADILNGHTADHFQPALVDWMTRATSYISVAAKLDFIKYNRVVPFVLPNGKTSMRYALQDTEQILQDDMAVGTTVQGPGQLTLAVSLRTALSRGRAHAGRIYPPTGGLGVEADGRVGTNVTNAAAISYATLIRDINAVVALDGTASVVVFSNVGQVVQNVQSVRVGRVLDTMRSRRTSLAEEPASALVNP